MALLETHLALILAMAEVKTDLHLLVATWVTFPEAKRRSSWWPLSAIPRIQ